MSSNEEKVKNVANDLQVAMDNMDATSEAMEQSNNVNEVERLRREVFKLECEVTKLTRKLLAQLRAGWQKEESVCKKCGSNNFLIGVTDERVVKSVCGDCGEWIS